LSGLAFASHARTLATASDKDGLLVVDARSGKRLPGYASRSPRAAGKPSCCRTTGSRSWLPPRTSMSNSVIESSRSVTWDLSATVPPVTWENPRLSLAVLRHRESDNSVIVIGGDEIAVKCWVHVETQTSPGRPPWSMQCRWMHRLARRQAIGGGGRQQLQSGRHRLGGPRRGRVIAKFSGHYPNLLTFSGDGRRSSQRGPAKSFSAGICWRFSALRQPPGRLSAKEAGRDWELLAGKDSARRLRRPGPAGALATGGRHLGAQAAAAGPRRATRRRIERLIAELGRRGVRGAQGRLRGTGAAWPGRRTRTAPGGPKQADRRVRLHLGQLLDKLEKIPPPGVPPCATAAPSKLLAWIGDSDARTLLEELRKGDPAAVLTRDARQALRTLVSRTARAGVATSDRNTVIAHFSSMSRCRVLPENHATSTAGSDRWRNRRPIRLEILEDRCVPAGPPTTWLVTTTADNNPMIRMTL